MLSSLTVSAIVPVLYGEPRLRETLERLDRLRSDLRLEVVVVADIPDAARASEVRAAIGPIADQFQAVAIYRTGERGFGSALRRGFAEANGDVLVPVMADVCDRVEDIVHLAAGIEGGLDVVGGSRYIRGGGIVGNTLKQRLSRLYSVLMRLAGGPPIHDVSNSFKAYRRSAIEAIRSEAPSFDVSVELTVKSHAAGLRVGEIPTVWTNRSVGSSTFDMAGEIRNYGRWLVFALWARLRPPPRRGGGAVEKDA